MRKSSLIEGPLRRDIPEYPPVALREALANAVAHRDYSSYVRGTPIDVKMFADRLEVRSPGGLFGNVTLDNIEEEHSTRNARLMRINKAASGPRRGQACLPHAPGATDDRGGDLDSRRPGRADSAGRPSGRVSEGALRGAGAPAPPRRIGQPGETLRGVSGVAVGQFGRASECLLFFVLWRAAGRF
jgi:hypothetical protein